MSTVTHSCPITCRVDSCPLTAQHFAKCRPYLDARYLEVRLLSSSELRPETRCAFLLLVSRMLDWSTCRFETSSRQSHLCCSVSSSRRLSNHKRNYVRVYTAYRRMFFDLSFRTTVWGLRSTVWGLRMTCILEKITAPRRSTIPRSIWGLQSGFFSSFASLV